MELDEQLKEFKSDRMHIRIEDKNLFKARVMRKLDDSKEKKGIHKRWIFILSPILILSLGGWGYQQYMHYVMWHKIHITNAQAQQPAQRITAIWTDKGMNAITERAFHITNLAPSRSKADFPIHEPKSVSGWTLIFSKGYTTHLYIQHVVNHQNVTDKVTESPVTYVDVYANKSGERVAVVQQKTSFDFNNPNVYVQFPSKTQYLSSFEPDFAALIPVKIMEADSNSIGSGDPHELSLFHKNSNGTVTNFQVTGTASVQVLEMFGREYVSAPIN